MATLTISEPVVLGCGDCDSGYYVETGADHATCAACRKTVTPSWDIERHLEWNERMVWVDDSTLRGPRWLAYFVEEEEAEED